MNIVLQKTNQKIAVKIIDYGIGFDYESAIKKGGLGLKNILIRIEYLKGTIKFLSNHRSGTQVLIEIPIS